MGAFFLGLDAGGTKTHCLVASGSGRVVGFAREGCGSYEGAGIAGARAAIKNAIGESLKSGGVPLEELTAVGLGVAGADLPQDYEMLSREVFDPLLKPIPYVLKNDSFAALRGGTRDSFGVVVNCGTGLIAAGRNRAGEEVRVGGLGPSFGDKTSGPDIAHEGLVAVFRADDGVEQPTMLAEMYIEATGTESVRDLLVKIYNGVIDQKMLPGTKMVFRAAARGDAVAQRILAEAGKELARMGSAVINKLGMNEDGFDLVMAGSVFKGESPVLIDEMRADVHHVAPSARLVMPLFEPVVGALLLGMELGAVAATDAVYANLQETLPNKETLYE
jgi:N-acetylglucosamine kinase-like BadF-type ATPase